MMIALPPYFLLPAFFVTIAIIFLKRGSWRNSLLPPGPKSLPVLGNLLELGQNPHLSLARLARTHGPVMYLKLGRIYTVVISSPSSAKEVLETKSHSISGRQIPHVMQACGHHKVSMAWSPPDQSWRYLRALMKTHFMSKQSLDANQFVRQRKVQELIAYIKGKKGDVVRIGRAAFCTVLNLISTTFLSIDMVDFKSESAQELKDLMGGLMEEDSFVAGSETSSTALEWAMAELLHRPQLLARAREEIAKFIGFEKEIQESDISRLPFLQAVLKETLRLHPPAPLLVPHKAEASTEINGYMIPKNTQVIVNVWAIGRDERVWVNPGRFEPERFMGGASEIDFRGKHFELTPFGSGRRICPGLPLGVRMVQLMLASLIIQSFEWSLPDGMAAEDLDLREKFGLSLVMASPLQAIANPSRQI